MAEPTGKKCLHWRRSVLLVLLLCGGTAYYYHLFIRHPQGEGPVHIPASPVPGILSANPVWLIGMGDSVTVGFGASPGKGYFSRLIDNPDEADPALRDKNLRALFPGLIATNLARSGSTSLQHLHDQLPRVPRDPTRKAIVLLTTGGNDLIHSYGMAPPKEGAMYGATWEQAQPWIAAFSGRLDTLARDLAARFPAGVEIFIGTIYDPSDGTGYLRHTGLRPWPEGVRILAAYNERIRQLGKAHAFVHPVEVHEPFLGHGLHATHWWESHYDRADPHCWLAENVEDPNNRGYDAIRRLYWNRIVSGLAP